MSQHLTTPIYQQPVAQSSYYKWYWTQAIRGPSHFGQISAVNRSAEPIILNLWSKKEFPKFECGSMCRLSSKHLKTWVKSQNYKVKSRLITVKCI
jgi:hypothetical protein